MKIYTKNGVLTAEAESVDDVRSLMAFQEVSNRKISDMTKPVGYPMKRGPYKKGKKNYIKPCPICGQKVKGLLGLSIHSKLTHGAWDKNKKVVPGTEPVLQTNDGGRGYSSGFGAGR